MRAPNLIWLPRRLHQQCVEDAARWYPLETGGVLMGYWNARSAVITSLVGPGLNPVHETHNFEPDQEWQLEEIARRYNVSDGRETYLGDWHTHPNAHSGRLSGTDRRVLRSILEHPKAKARQPIMMIMFGAEASWNAEAWSCFQPPGRPRWLGPRITGLSIKVWDAT